MKYNYTVSLTKEQVELLKKELKKRTITFSGFLDSVIRSAVAGMKTVKKEANISFGCFILEDTGKKGKDRYEGTCYDGKK